MTAQSKIEWTDSTFNPWIGCTRVSPACDHCYAEAQMATRMGRVEWGAGKPRSRTSAAYWRQPLRWNARSFWRCDTCGWRGEGPHLDGLLDEGAVRELCPQCWPALVAAKPARRRVFCASLADVFDNEVDPVWRADLISLIGMTPNLDWLLLTKRIGNAAAMLKEAKDYWAFSDRPGKDWQNVWLGATICNQAEADRDIPKLLAVPAAKRFLSIEPMLGPVDLMPMFEHRADAHSDTGIDWIICGGESGPHARPMHPDWVRSLRDQCAAAGVPFLFKQWGEWAPRGPESMGYPLVDSVPRIRLTNRGENGQDLGAKGGEHCWMQRAGKHAAGRLLDGVEHNGVPA